MRDERHHSHTTADFDAALAELADLAVRREELRRADAPFEERIQVTERQQELRARLAGLRPEQPVAAAQPTRRRGAWRGRAA